MSEDGLAGGGTDVGVDGIGDNAAGSVIPDVAAAGAGVDDAFASDVITPNDPPPDEPPDAKVGDAVVPPTVEEAAFMASRANCSSGAIETPGAEPTALLGPR